MKPFSFSKLAGLFLVMTLTGLVGCQSVSTFFVGRPVDKTLTIVLPEGQIRNGTWNTFDVVIDYSANKHDGQLDLSGSVRLTDRYGILYESLNRLDVYLFLLNSDGNILKTVALTGALSTTIDQRLNFSQRLALPAGTSAISFGYRGKVSSMDGGATFDELPQQN